MHSTALCLVAVAIMTSILLIHSIGFHSLRVRSSTAFLVRATTSRYGASRQAAASASSSACYNSPHVPRKKLLAISYNESEAVATSSMYTGPVPENNKPLEPGFVKELMAHMRSAPAGSGAKSRSHLPPKAYVDAILRASLEQHKNMPFLVNLKIPSATPEDPIDSSDPRTDITDSSSIGGGEEDGGGGGGSMAAVNYDSKGPSLTLCGDTHGQYCDFADLLLGSPKAVVEAGAAAPPYRVPSAGFPSNARQYLFNGDFVDRGSQSFEILLSLLALKLSMPSSVHMIRGNHELTEMNKYYGFEKEVLQKYDKDVLSQLRCIFDLLPLAAVVEQEAFVVHGGIGPLTHNMTLAEIAVMRRPSKEYEAKIFASQSLNNLNSPSGPAKNCSTVYNNDKYVENLREEYVSDLERCHELLWADPSDEHLGFKESPRGDSIRTFGKDVSASFLQRNGLRYIVRSHEVQMNGFASHHEGLVYTVFSAPNYCGSVGNLGAVMRLRRAEGDEQIRATVYPMFSFAAKKKAPSPTPDTSAANIE